MSFLMSQNHHAHSLLPVGQEQKQQPELRFTMSLLTQQVGICEGSIILTEQRALGLLASLTRRSDWSQPWLCRPREIVLGCIFSGS